MGIFFQNISILKFGLKNKNSRELKFAFCNNGKTEVDILWDVKK
ncbi:hypothetical protein GMMP15_1620024 [Candidatus Magnetomoraceae bacterium gMMP-15]